MRFDGGFEGAETERAVVGLGTGVHVRVRHYCNEDRHGAAENVDEGVGDNEFDDLEVFSAVSSPPHSMTAVTKPSM